MGQVTITSFLLLVTLTAKVHSNFMPEIDTPAVIRIREDIPEGALAFEINARDPDGDTLTYGLSPGGDSHLFHVDPVTGNVTVNSPLDREAKEVLSVEITVKDPVNTAVTLDVRIILEDANDNFPIFQGLPYTPKIKETLPTGSSIFQVSADDSDSGTAAAVSYSLTGCSPPDGRSLFDIQRTTGIINLKGELSFTDKSSFYQLTVLAEDGGGPLGNDHVVQSSSTFVFITVEDVPNLAPVFLNLPDVATVPEKSSLGTTVYTVLARDPDTGVGSPIEYSIKSFSVGGLFDIGASSGIITVVAELDREQYLDGVVTLEIEAKETEQDVNGMNAAASNTLQITIEDINDEMPKFYTCASDDDCASQTVFTGNIDENSAVGLPVLGLSMTVKDKDKGDNSKFSLSIIEGQDSDAFTISPSLAISRTDVQILMKNPANVDFEKTPFITLTVIAVDTMKPTFKSTATVTIAINDLNDNSPEFEQDTYKLEVEEHSAAGTIIAIITATDLDQSDVGNLVYQLFPESIRQYFTVDPATGQITVQDGTKLDREGQSFYTATLQAKDPANNIGTANLEITLLDKNDNPPIIRETYIAFVREDATDLKVTIRATDFDQPGTDNSKIEYQIVPDEFSNYFNLDQDTGVLTLKGGLDREALDASLNGVIKLNVTATDKGLPPLGTWVEVEINVEDVNDNKPVFKPKDYNFVVKESLQGALINSVFAEDLDQTVQNNRISFRIIGGGAGTFSVRSIQTPDKAGYWGNISVDQDSMLDYEERKTYEFTVEALDPEQQTDTATVHVTVEDVNDETPSLSAGQEMSVIENTTIDGGLVGVIEAKDVDTKHELKYELLSTECPCNKTGVCQEEWFLVEPEGQVILNPEYEVDYEMCNEVLLHVRVTDVLTEIGKNSSEGTITVRVQDINDNAPEFIFVQSHFVVVAENTNKDTSVARVSATDRDTIEGNVAMNFEVLEVHFVNTNNHSEKQDNIFKTVEEPQTSINRSATIQSLYSLPPDMKGKYVVTVQVSNTNGLRSTSDVVIFTVDKEFRVSLEFHTSVTDFEANERDIKWALEAATGTTVHIVNRQPKGRTKLSDARATPVTIVEAYFIFANGTALKHDTVLNLVNGNTNPEYSNTLSQHGLAGVNAGEDESQGGANTEMYVLLATVGGLFIVVVVLVTSLFFMRRNYTRKLKASKAMNSATMAITENQKSGPVVPGTNKYTREGANPVLNLNIDNVTDLGFDEEDSNDDRASLNSLDYNIDMNMSDRDTMPMMVIEEEDEENGFDNSGFNEPLGAALAHRGQRRARDVSPAVSFNDHNPSTTDL